MFKFILFLTLLSICCAGNHPKCGTKGPNKTLSSFIVGGRLAKRGDWPWMGSLMYPQQRRGSTKPVLDHWCGCSLLNENWAITAAHCVERNKNASVYRAVFGMHNRKALIKEPWNKVNESDTLQIRNVFKIIMHPQYNKPWLNNDVALLKLSTPINLTRPGVGTICLPNKQPLDDVVKNSPCMAIGWGLPSYQARLMLDQLEQVPVTVHKQEDCRIFYSQSRDVQLSDGMVCIGKNGKGICHGDSGGPLNCKVNGTWFSYGAASFGRKGCHNDNTPSVYARTSEYSKWVWDTIANQTLILN